MLTTKHRKLLKKLLKSNGLLTSDIKAEQQETFDYLCEKKVVRIEYIQIDLMNGYTKYVITQTGVTELENGSIFNIKFVITQIILPIALALITTLITIALTNVL